MGKIYFKADESPSNVGKYLIRPVLENFPDMTTRGSYNLLAARCMDLTYAQYLRMCRDLFGAEIIGKNTKYPLAFFSKSERLKELVRELNRHAYLIFET